LQDALCEQYRCDDGGCGAGVTGFCTW
jgi:hypothetical protein